MLKTQKGAKWLESVKKNALIDILEKPYKRMFKRSTLPKASVGLSPEALREQKIQRVELERKKAQAIEYVRRSQIR